MRANKTHEAAINSGANIYYLYVCDSPYLARQKGGDVVDGDGALGTSE